MRRRPAAVLAAVTVVCALAGCASRQLSGASSTSLRAVVSAVDPEPTTSPPTSSSLPRTPKIDRGDVPPEAARFAWATGDVVPESMTITVVRGLSPLAALRTVAPHPVVAVLDIAHARARIEQRNATLDPGDYTNDVQMVAATSRNGWTLVLEDNGLSASQPSVAARLSRAGTANVLFHNVEVDYSYLYARNGRVVRNFDPFADSSYSGRALPQERTLRFGAGKRFLWTDPLCLELTRRLTGFVVRPSDFDFDSYTYAVGVTL